MNVSNWCRSLAAAGLIAGFLAATPLPAQDQKESPAPPQAENPGAESVPATPDPAPADSTVSEAAKPGTSQPAATPPAGSEAPAAEDAQSPTRFIPTQKSTADNSATFPVDI